MYAIYICMQYIDVCNIYIYVYIISIYNIYTYIQCEYICISHNCEYNLILLLESAKLGWFEKKLF